MFMTSPTPTHPHNGHLWIVTLVLSALSVTLTIAPVAAQDSDALLINDPRPLALAITHFEQRCHCIVTYEDPKWQKDQVIEGQVVRNIPNRPPAMIPKGIPFLTSIKGDLASAPRSTISTALRTVLDDFERQAHHGDYRLVDTGRVFHVVPAVGSVLDVPLALPEVDVPLGTAVTTILAEVRKARGHTVLVGAVPNNLLRKVASLRAASEPASDVLDRLFLESGVPISWRLLYDFDYSRHFLSLAVVH